MLEANHWEKKYHTANKEFLTAQKQHSDALNAVKQDLLRLTHLGDNLDPVLDQQLDNLRRLLQEDDNADARIRKEIKQITTRLREVDKQSNALQQQLKSGFSQLGEPMLPLINDKTIQAQIRQFKKIASRCQNKQQMAQLLEEYHRLLNNVAEHLQERMKNQKTQPGFLQRIADLLCDLAKRSPKATTSSNSELTATSQTQAPQSLCQGLLQLIELFPNLKEHSHARDNLLATLKSNPNASLISDLCTQTSDYLLALFNQQSQKHEAFLKKVNQRLDDMTHFINHMNQAEAERWQDTETLNQNINSQIDLISQDISQATTLAKLQNDIKQRLDKITHAIGNYHHHERDRIQAAHQTIATIQRRLQDIEQDKQSLEAQLVIERDKAKLESLTELFNRQAYDEHFALLFDNWQQQGTAISLIISDIDYFKQINDKHGHMAGDKILKILGTIYRDHTREHDFVARYGGEEIVLLLQHTDLASAQKIANKLRRVINSWKFPVDGKLLQITSSFGVTQLRMGDTAESAFARVDKALYQAKDGGRDQVVCL